ncbi:MAG: hypothetical protein ACTSRW_02275 [Candidatus Helarchaeota archaeon]
MIRNKIKEKDMRKIKYFTVGQITCYFLFILSHFLIWGIEYSFHPLAYTPLFIVIQTFEGIYSIVAINFLIGTFLLLEIILYYEIKMKKPLISKYLKKEFFLVIICGILITSQVLLITLFIHISVIRLPTYNPFYFTYGFFLWFFAIASIIFLGFLILWDINIHLESKIFMKMYYSWKDHLINSILTGGIIIMSLIPVISILPTILVTLQPTMFIFILELTLILIFSVCGVNIGLITLANFFLNRQSKKKVIKNREKKEKTG